MARKIPRILTAVTLFAAAGLTFAPLAQASGNGPVYSFGIVPQQAGAKLARLWSPILAYLEQQTGYRLQFRTARNIPTFEKRLKQDTYDFGYMNPFQYVTYHKKSGYQAFATAKDKRLKGILVVLKNSPYRTLKDLDGKSVALPEQAFAADLVMRATFRKRGISVDPHVVASHDASYRSVADGRFAAGGGVLRTFHAEASAVRDKLRVLWTTPGYTPHAFAAAPNVPPRVVRRLQQALVNMSNSAQGLAMLKAIKLKGVMAARNSDWNDVRALHLRNAE